MRLEFLMTSLIVVVIPGTGVIYTVSVALTHGRRRGLVAAIGCTLAIVPHLIAAVFGLSGFLHAGALAFRMLKYAGVIYLLFLAVSMFRSTGATAFDNHDPAPTGSASVVVRGVLLNLLNPKLTVFFFAFLPQFVPSTATTSALLGLGAVFMVLTLGVFAIYAVIAPRLCDAFATDSRGRRRLEKSMAGLLAGFAVKLAFTDQ
jgi:threonine/homoserine/homoserine lactone efflux protein